MGVQGSCTLDKTSHSFTRRRAMSARAVLVTRPGCPGGCGSARGVAGRYEGHVRRPPPRAPSPPLARARAPRRRRRCAGDERFPRGLRRRGAIGRGRRRVRSRVRRRSSRRGPGGDRGPRALRRRGGRGDVLGGDGAPASDRRRREKTRSSRRPNCLRFCEPPVRTAVATLRDRRAPRRRRGQFRGADAAQGGGARRDGVLPPDLVPGGFSKLLGPVPVGG